MVKPLPLPPVADPERGLVIAYAPLAARLALAILWALDERLAQIVTTTREAGIGLIRLAWWREALERLDQAPAPAEPLLQQVAALVLPRGVAGRSLGTLADGWAALLADPLDDDARETFAVDRGAALFAAAAQLLGAADSVDVAEAGAGWALADLAHRTSSEAASRAALAAAERRLGDLRTARWPRSLRPLAALAVLARRDAKGGRRTIRPGSLGRVARLAVTGLLGR